MRRTPSTFKVVYTKQACRWGAAAQTIQVYLAQVRSENVLVLKDKAEPIDPTQNFLKDQIKK